MATAVRVWSGVEALEPLLVPLDELRPHERNPRRGDVDAIRASVARFGQQRPILALADGTIVAGNHTFHALRAEGWTHAAVLRSSLAGAEVEAYLLADNRTGDLAVYDEVALAELLRPFYESATLEGLGYRDEDVRALLESVGGWLTPDGDPSARLDELGTRVPGGREFTLAYSDEEADEFVRLVEELQARYETRSMPATVLVALREAGA